ncbi:hypothetical protein ACFVZH_19870 [Streptomyces sp. NPDC059534]|uniref:hypothetical protein n=1 Tax=Streptomyces sp. NPDC059534 TaxID=3346859 RepID=UPI00367844AC
MRAKLFTTRTSSPLRTAAALAAAAVLGLTLFAAAAPEHEAPSRTHVTADGPIDDDTHEEWDSRG